MRTCATQRTLAILLLAAAPAHAQMIFELPPAFSTRYDTSIRAAAMGGAGAAVLWGEPGVWANPATLSGVSGVGWVTGHTDVTPVPGTILPAFEDQLEFSSQRVLVGGGGLGFSLMGQPISGLGKSQFDYGPVPPGYGSYLMPYDRTEGWGVGVSPLKLIESIRKLGKMAPAGLTSYGDVALGYQSKASKVVNDPDTEFDLAGTYDWGA